MRIRDWSSDVCSSDLQHLNLDVARLLDVLLDEHALVAEAGARLVAGRAQALAHLGLAARDTHALAAAAGGSLDHPRVADRLGDLHRGRLVVDGIGMARHRADLRLGGQLLWGRQGTSLTSRPSSAPPMQR